MVICRLASRSAFSAVFLLAACGGGGGGGAPQPSTYTVSGTVSGLTGTLTLQNNGVDRLTVTANGSFSFATRIAAGGAYAVTVLSQPYGPDCMVTGGEGVVTANVASVTVSCSVNPDTRFIPLKAFTPGTGDPAGLYVLTSKDIGRMPVQISAAPIEEVAVSPDQVLTANATIASARPGLLVYRRMDATTVTHLFALDLRGSSNLVPRQIGSIAFRADDGMPSALPALCFATKFLRKLDDPASASLIVTTGTDLRNGCSGIVHRYVVHADDPPTTAPREISWEGGNIHPLYRPDGMLAGIVGADPVTGDVVFFDDDTFTTSRTLLPGPVSYQSMLDGEFLSASDSTWTDRAGSQTSAVIEADDANASILYRIDYDATVHMLYDITEVVDVPVRQGANLYLQDRDATLGTVTAKRVPVDGSAPQALYSFAPDPACDVRQSAWLGHLGQNELLWQICWDRTSNATSTIMSLPGPALTTPTTLATYPSVLYGVSLAKDSVLVSYSSLSANPTPTGLGEDFATEVLDGVGNVVLPKAPSAFLTFEGSPVDAILQARDFTGPGYQGGALYDLALPLPATPTLTRLSYPDGTPALLPSNTDSGYGMTIAPKIVYAIFFSDQEAAVMVDLTRNLAVKLSGSGMDLRLISFLN